MANAEGEALVAAARAAYRDADAELGQPPAGLGAETAALLDAIAVQRAVRIAVLDYVAELTEQGEVAKALEQLTEALGSAALVAGVAEALQWLHPPDTGGTPITSPPEGPTLAA